MAHTLVIELPDEVFEPLAHRARAAGRTPEDFVRDRIADAAVAPEDPLARFIGAFDSGVTDLGERHDRYIGEHLTRELHDEEP